MPLPSCRDAESPLLYTHQYKIDCFLPFFFPPENSFTLELNENPGLLSSIINDRLC